MTGLPSFPPQEPGKRPSADGATVVPGRTERMSKPRRRTISDTPTPALRQQRSPSSDTPPPSYAPARQAPRPVRRNTPIALPVDEQPQPAPQPQRNVQSPPPRPPRRRRRKRRVILPILLLLVVALIAWPFYLVSYGNSKLNHVDALSGAPNTPGRTILFAGTDQRSEDGVNDGVEGQRSDSIMLVHIPDSGNTSLISLPRDTYVSIPDYGYGKLNTAYSVGGAELLVRTVEGLSGLTVDHYVEVGMDGISELVDSVGGIELCLDYDVDDPMSGLVWEAGCHEADGTTALAFTRMRYQDPLGDIGRTARQRQVIAQVMNEVVTPSTLVNPMRQRDIVGSIAEVLTTDHDTSMMDLARIGWPMRSIMGPDGIIGTPPISSLNYQPGGVGSTVLLDPERTDEFFRKVADGSITQDDVAMNLL